MKMNDRWTARKIEHILSWIGAIKAKYVWTETDKQLEDFLKDYQRYLSKVNAELEEKNKLELS